jgi:hypothetical protein
VELLGSAWSMWWRHGDATREAAVVRGLPALHMTAEAALLAGFEDLSAGLLRESCLFVTYIIPKMPLR